MSIKELKENKETICKQLDEIKATVGEGVMSDEQLAQWDELQGQLTDLNSQIETKERFLSIEAKPQAEKKAPVVFSRQAGKHDDINAFRAWALTKAQRDDAIPTSWMEAASRQGINLNKANYDIAWNQDSTGNVNAIPGASIGGVLKKLQDKGGLMSVVSVMNTTNANPLRFNLRDTTAYKAAIISELGNTTNTTQTDTAVTLNGYSYRSGIFQISQELLQDAGYDVMADYQDALVDSFRLGFGEHIAVGDGTGQPVGVDECTTSVNLDGTGANVISYSTLVDLYHSVDSAYRASNSCAFAMSDATLAVVKKLVDDAGRPLWNSSFNSNIVAGQEGFLLGKRIVVDSWLTDNHIVFGDFSRYRVRLVGNVRTQVLNELYAISGGIGLVGFARMDCNLLDANAIKKLVSAE